MKKSLSVLLAASLSLAACQNIEQLVPEVADDVLSARIEQGEVTKTALGESNNILWSEDDQIVAFMKTSYGHKYQIQSSFVGKTYANFSKISSVSGDDLSAGMKWDHNVAYYPYAEGIECVKSDVNYTLDVVIPAEQTYAENSFGNGYFPMVAVSEDNDITFKNVCGGMKLQLKGTQKVTSITVQGKNNEVLSGTATVTAYTDGEPKSSITMTGTDAASKSVTLDCGAGVQLSESTVTEFIIALPPVDFTEGFAVIITDSKGNEHIVTSDRENEVIRSSLLIMPEVTLEDPTTEVPEGECVNLSQSGTANSYIVSQKGSYKFSTVKGNSSESVGIVVSAQVLWESFGTDVTPNVGDLVKNASYSDGYITFQTADTFKEGNAVIAAKDASGNILWSWHIWLTDEPQGQVYYNNAGTMMDRNLGATSATPGDVGALGLLYQWGRKDPFLGSSSISSAVEAKSTITWPSCAWSRQNQCDIDYSIANPTTFISCNEENYDWDYTGSVETEDSRWTTSEFPKSIYDPCPVGWRVPDGGENSIWARAIGSVYTNVVHDQVNQGSNVSGLFGFDDVIWYPAAGQRSYYRGTLYDTGFCSASWSSTTYFNQAHELYFAVYYYTSLELSNSSRRAVGNSVRCIKEETTPSTPAEPESVDLSEEGTANSYIVSQAGAYKFSTVKGNSSESVGAVASAEVLWETFGTNVTPNVGDLVKNASYSDGYITFQTADTFKEGNAVIAAKDASGNILWSWHIWLTDEPEGQVYYNNAGTMMDRNLGATSATPGDVGALGLLYQWGRKDPFLGGSSISSFNEEAASTITWPSAVSSASSNGGNLIVNGTIEYATAHPTTFITYNYQNVDWYYTGDSSTDNTRWTESDKAKSIYDPCPAGWRVPDGGEDGVWSTALGSSSDFTDSVLYDGTNEGMNFSGRVGSDATIWYPSSGFRNNGQGSLYKVGYDGYYWSASPSASVRYYAYRLYFYSSGNVNPSCNFDRALGYSVRCVRE